MTRLSVGLLAFAVMASPLLVWVQRAWPNGTFEVMMFGLAAVWLGALALGRVPLRPSFALCPLAAAALWAGSQLAIGTTVNAAKTEAWLLYWCAGVACFFAVIETFPHSRQRAGFLTALTVYGVVLAVVSTAQYYTGGSQVFWLFQSPIDIDGIMGPFLNRNHYCAYMELILPIAMYRALMDEEYGPWYAVATGTIYASMVASSSRGGAVLGISELVAVPVLLAIRGKIRFRDAVPALGALVLAIVSLVFGAGYENVIGRLGQSDPYAGRREFAISSAAMAKDHLLTGVGLGNWPTVYPRYALFDDGNFVNAAHNDWAQWLAEGGIAMLLMMLALAAWTVPRAVRSVWGIGVIAILLHSWVDFSLQRMPVALLFFLMLGLLEFEGPHKHHRTGLQ